MYGVCNALDTRKAPSGFIRGLPGREAQTAGKNGGNGPPSFPHREHPGTPDHGLYLAAKEPDPFSLRPPTPTRYSCCWVFESFHRKRRNSLDHFDERSDEVTVQYLANLTDRLHLGPRFTYVGLGAAPDSAGFRPPVTLDPDGLGEIPGLGVVMEFDSRNVTSYPTQGSYLSVSAMQYGRFLGGPADYPRLEMDLRWYRELAGPQHSLAAYALLTATSGEMGTDVPIHQDYHLQVGLVRFDFGVGKFHPDFSVSLHIGGGEKALAQKARVR